MNESFEVISREAALAAAHIGIGVTALGSANYAEDAYYFQAFFALSIGFERTAKLALVIDHALDWKGAFPSHKVVRGFGHNLRDLLEQADGIAAKRNAPDPEERLPRHDIHDAIIDVLSDFASNVTRYYNLDFLTGDPRAAKIDPVGQWHTRVTEPVIARHYTERARQRNEHQARVAEAMMSSFASVVHTSETGTPIRSTSSAILHGAATTTVRPFTRMYVLQIARFLGHLMSTLSFASYQAGLESIPHLSDFYRIFNNDDRYFRARKRWSIYHL